jgi:hypothetical protein
VRGGWLGPMYMSQLHVSGLLAVKRGPAMQGGAWPRILTVSVCKVLQCSSCESEVHQHMRATAPVTLGFRPTSSVALVW